MTTAPTTQARQFADGLERSLWTVAEAAGATGIVAGYQALPLPDVPGGYVPLTIILVAGVLAGIKSSIAQRWGNGTAATLPEQLEPLPAVSAEELAAVGDVEQLSPSEVDDLVQQAHDERDVNGDHRDDRTGRFLPRS